jgi:hypothetical protein
MRNPEIAFFVAADAVGAAALERELEIADA